MFHEYTRRNALQIGGLGILGLTLPKLLRASEAGPASGLAENGSGAKPGRAKSVIFLYQFGGPSHLDSFDPKPNAPSGVRTLNFMMGLAVGRRSVESTRSTLMLAASV